jgi:Tfp pilus assembly protein PilP
MKSSLAALSFGVLLSGCSTQLPQPPARPVAPAPVAVAPAPAAQVSEPEVAYSYMPIKRDPFVPVIHNGPPPLPACEGPLCRYSLDELKLAGVISGTSHPVAVLESPLGKGYSVYQGSKVGKNGGVVKQVLRDSIVVAEFWHDGQGLMREEEIILRVKPDMPVTLDE